MPWWGRADHRHRLVSLLDDYFHACLYAGKDGRKVLCGLSRRDVNSILGHARIIRLMPRVHGLPGHSRTSPKIHGTISKLWRFYFSTWATKEPVSTVPARLI